MKLFGHGWLLIIILICSVAEMMVAEIVYRPQKVTCTNSRSPCYMKRITCPEQCPLRWITAPKVPISCFVNCDSPICQAECRYRKINCNAIGAACYDPRLIGADGAVFYFHGKSNQHFTLVSDTNLQINARFIGHRPAGRPRDYTWIQALGILFGSHNFSVEAIGAATWDDNVDHLKFTFDSNEILVPSLWRSETGDVVIERISSRNSVIVSIPGTVEIGVNVVPITEHEDRVHNYQIPFGRDCFAHLEVQFRSLELSPAVEAVLGRTYRPDYESSGKLGVAMPVVGGEDEYRTTSLFATDCKKCVAFSANGGDKYSTRPVLETIAQY